MTTETTMPPETGTIVPVLSLNEQVALLECEDQIRRGLKSFVEMGNALKRIRDSKLYRERFKTFEAYCEVTWDISDRRARQLWAAAAVVGLLAEKSFHAVPLTESQARPLTELPAEEQAAAWEEIVATAPCGKITAAHVAQVVERRRARLEGKEKCRVPGDRCREKPIDVPDLATREKRIRAAAREAQLRLIELQDLIGTADGVAAANVGTSIQGIDELQDHLARKGEMLNSRFEQKQAEGTEI